MRVTEESSAEIRERLKSYLPCTYKEGSSWYLDETKGFRVTLSSLEERLMFSKEVVELIENITQTSKNDVLLIYPNYNISWYGFRRMETYFGQIEETPETDLLRYRVRSNTDNLSKCVEISHKYTESSLAVGLYDFLTFLKETELDFPQYLSPSPKGEDSQSIEHLFLI